MDIITRPGVGLDALWFRNVYGYFESARKQNKGLSFLQLMQFWYVSDSVDGHLPKPFGLFMTWFFGMYLVYCSLLIFFSNNFLLRRRINGTSHGI